MAGGEQCLKVLFSARDPAAAQAIGNIVKQACADQRFAVHVILSPPASELLNNFTCECTSLSPEVISSQQLLSLSVCKVLEEFHPDAIIAGASGPDVGVDEILIKNANGIRSYVVQDFWGDVNLALGVAPDCYLVVDKIAAELTQQKVKSETYIVGSVKHTHYGKLNFSELRSSGRQSFGFTQDETIVGYFGMPLGHLKGYWRTLEALVESLQGLPVKLIYRSHPKEDESMRNHTYDILKSIGKYSVDNNDCIEKSLAACDLIISCYSSCGLDSELLGRNLKHDNRLSMFLLFDTEIYEYYKNYTGLDDIPLSLVNRSLTIKNRSNLSKTLKKYLSKNSRRDFICTDACLPTVDKSVDRVLNKVIYDHNLSTSVISNL